MRVMVDLTSMKIMRWREVAPIIGCSLMTIARMEKAGTFPQRIRIGNGSVGWLEHEVEAWLAGRMANRVEDEGAPQDNEIDESMDGDNASALASAGLGTDEDYGGGCDRF